LDGATPAPHDEGEMPVKTKAETETSTDRKPAEPSPDAIAKRAYELYLQRGSVPGYELEDWLTAEAELVAEAAVAAHET
jgi:hypothetical protein